MDIPTIVALGFILLAAGIVIFFFWDARRHQYYRMSAGDTWEIIKVKALLVLILEHNGRHAEAKQLRDEVTSVLTNVASADKEHAE